MASDERNDEAGVGPYVRQDAELVRLRDLDDWDITGDAADVRGWEVCTLGGRELGRVQDLLVDRDLREVVMLEIDLRDSPRTGRAPLRAAEIDRDRRCVRLDSADITVDGEALADTESGSIEAAADDIHDEVVVDQRPVVVEETVVRRRPVDDRDEESPRP